MGIGRSAALIGSTTLLSSATMTRRAVALATIFSRSSAPPRPLMRWSVPTSTSSAPSMVRSMRGLFGERGERECRGRAPAPRSSPKSRRRRSAGRAAADRLNDQRRRSAAPESDNHAVLDQRGGGFGGGEFCIHSVSSVRPGAVVWLGAACSIGVAAFPRLVCGVRGDD